MTSEAPRPRVELVVLLASAGGLDALSVVLGDLPTEFPAAVVVQQHLGGLSSVLPRILARHTSHRVSWARDGQSVAPGQVVVCPPGVHVELTPDGRCHVRQTESLGERRFDVLLASVAGSYGPRSAAVILSGSGQDGAVGTVAMKHAGAVVIAQSPDTAQYSSMPVAAARAGADRVVPIHEIGRLLADLVAGAPLPEPREGETAWAAMVSAASGAAGGEVTSAQPDSQASLNQAMNSAATRAELARLRAAELMARRRDLSAGFGATAQTVATAQRRAQESSRRALLAHQAAEEAAARWPH